MSEPVTGRCRCGCGYRGIKQDNELWLLERDGWQYYRDDSSVQFEPRPDDELWAKFVAWQLTH
jgi:hypothetical protein